MYAAISPEFSRWRDKLVRVRYGSRSVVVKVVDCLCSRRGGVDLYADAFSRLAPLSRGVITVRVEVVR